MLLKTIADSEMSQNYGNFSRNSSKLSMYEVIPFLFI